MGLYNHRQAKLIFGKLRDSLNCLDDDLSLHGHFSFYKKVITDTWSGDAFTEIANNGFNCVMDTLYCPGVASKNSKNEEIKAKALRVGHKAFTHLSKELRRKNLSPQKILALYIASNEENVNCLHIAALHASEETFLDYIDIIEGYYKSRHLSLETYKHLLTQRNADGRTPLNSIKDPGGAQKFKRYLAVAKKRLSSRELIELFSLASENGYAPLHNAVMDNNVKIFKRLCSELSKLHRKKKLSTKEFLKILTAKTDNEQTLLHLIFRKSSPDILSLYFDLFTDLLAVRDQTGDPIFYPNEFIRIITKENGFGYTPLHLVKDPDNVRIYLDKLIELHKKGLFATEDFIATLTVVGNDGFTPLHHFMALDDSQNVAVYLNVLNYLHRIKKEDAGSLLSTPVYFKILSALNYSDVTPLTSGIHSGNKENLNLYFYTIFDLYNEVNESGEHFISIEDCLSILMQPNNGGFTPFHQMLSRGAEEQLEIYLRYLSVFQEIARKVISSDSVSANLLNFFLSRTQYGGNVLHCSLSAQSTKNNQICFEILDNFENEGRLSASSYVKLLISRDQSGETPLSLALQSGRSENLARYLSKLEYFYKKEDLSNEEYRELILQPNNQGDLPFHNAIRLQHQESLLLYLEALDKLHQIRHPQTRERLLSRKDYLKILTNQGDFRTTLAELANTGNMQLIGAFFTHIERIFNESELYEMLTDGFKNYTLGRRKDKAHIDDYFLDKRESYKLPCEERRRGNRRKRPFDEARDGFFAHHSLGEPPLNRRRTYNGKLTEF